MLIGPSSCGGRPDLPRSVRTPARSRSPSSSGGRPDLPRPVRTPARSRSPSSSGGRPDLPRSVRTPARSRPPTALRVGGDDGGEALRHLRLRYRLVAVRRDGRHGRVDAPDGVRPAGGGILVGRLPESPHGQLDGLLPPEVRPPPELDSGAGVTPSGA